VWDIMNVQRKGRMKFLALSERYPFAAVAGRYFLAIATLGVTTVPLFLQRGALNTSTVAVVYLLPVLISTTLWGLGPGIVTSLVAFLAYNYFFLLPYYTFVVHDSQDIGTLAIFLMVAVLISQLVGRAKRNLDRSIDRECELARLYELSLALAGVNSVQEIAQITARQMHETFQAEFVRVHVESFDHETCAVHLPADGRLPSAEPAGVVALETARGVLGEVQLWRDGPVSEGAELRLLRTLSTQGALALERAFLAQAETRTRVLEESDRLKTALLSSVSHELRTPLATIKAAITSLSGDEVVWETAAREDLLAVVDEETDHLNHLVGNLLDMSRIEAGALHPHRQWNDLAEIVEGVSARLHRALQSHRLQVHIPEDFPLLPVDYVQMEQVFSNLFSNCVKYAPEGSTIQVTVEKQTGEIMLVQVLNASPPVPGENLERIFDKFYQRTDKERGIGLGLSICKGIVEAHGGRIWAENLPQGFAFKFTLPLTWDGAPSRKVVTENV